MIENNLKSQQNDARENIIGLLRSKVGTDNAKTIDSRIEKILPSLRTEMDELSLSEVANFAQLSPSRFRHLFKEETGISFSSYKLWLKTQKAVRLLITNKDIINAAHAGGFFDQPHFSRILKRSFGLSPLEMKKNPHFELKIFS
ncbi:helix-turn-helix transcriptional regulator [Leptospira sp. FAT2]|uniref:helix-turn-helix transcriptional regulator n=1 Tax=Leptospira sanjuanensis TaxID=2879643 RepID=UPI001EE915F5|nr:helix-turn-helix transcriptional regulator [Leptospira sanjuanensis]MCG6192345.1 helix-turn-helix transcriptional regulator [Leptospira sanjuanensis]